MCGFSGFLQISSFEKNYEFIKNELKTMNDQISYRGPDKYGDWIDFDSKIAMGHRRLSILELSSLGDQPMTSHSDRFVICFNGEIYNHLDLRSELINNKFSINWKGHSDTETLLACFDAWGVERAIKKCVGMFSIALWDKKKRELILIRDRFGEKPLYYGWQGDKNNFFLFGSELKSLRKHHAFNSQINKHALSEYFKYNYIPSPFSIYKGISKLEPGNILYMSSKNYEIKIKKYWSVENNLLKNRNVNTNSLAENSVQLESILNQTIKKQMIADVPVGVFLSSGIDSSLVASVMQNNSEKSINSFTIGFSENFYNEAKDAKKIAAHLGCDHHESYLSSKEISDVIPRMPLIYDEPFSDSSQIPTYLVSKMSKKKVTVCLSGDGADEIFCGYNRYKYVNEYWPIINKLPVFLKKIMYSLITNLIHNKFLNSKKLLPKILTSQNFEKKIYKLANSLQKNNIHELYQFFIKNNNLSVGIADNFEKSTNIINSLKFLDNFQLNDAEKIMIFDLINYLPDDILTKVDRASMQVSLECRSPFLDHKLVEYAWNLPFKQKFDNGNSKLILRKILKKYIPENLISRNKMGFAIPLNNFLKTSLREWAEDLLNMSRLKENDIIDYNKINEKWHEHQKGTNDWSQELWSVLNFLSWSRSK